MPGKDLKMIIFSNGHPNDEQTIQKKHDSKDGRILEQQVFQLVESLLPEIYNDPRKNVSKRVLSQFASI